MTYFGEGDYAKAEEKLMALQPSNDTITYFLAASQLYQGKTELVDAALQPLANDQTSGFSQKAAWLRVLTALKIKDQAKARQLLVPILADANHDFYDKALELQKDLSE